MTLTVEFEDAWLAEHDLPVVECGADDALDELGRVQLVQVVQADDAVRAALGVVDGRKLVFLLAAEQEVWKTTMHYNEHQSKPIVSVFSVFFSLITELNQAFFQPMQMPCGHVFCQFCLSDWKKECSNKPFVCPNCRHKVQRDKVVPNIYLENLIQSWTKALGPETLKERERVLEERKGERLSPIKLSH